MADRSATPPQEIVPEPSDLRRVFDRHHSHVSALSGEVVYQQLEEEQSIKRQYSGRVLFELLQNALDRAAETIRVQLVETPESESGYSLLVANDGKPITVDPQYDYEDPPDRRGETRPDFNALCSTHTSNKTADESVGNKGVGFRSVFSVGEYARVWSRFRETAEWWGIELHLPLTEETWESQLSDPDVAAGHDAYLPAGRDHLDDDEERPSFHYPLPLRSQGDTTPVEHGTDASTAIVVPITEQGYEQLRESIEELQATHLDFLGLFEDRRNLEVHFETPETAFTRRTWPRSGPNPDRRIWYWNDPGLESEAAAADLSVSDPGAAVAWPASLRTQSSSERETPDRRVYAYLPTRTETPFGIDVHGDFQLQVDRKSLQLESNQAGDYNRTLLEASAEIHLSTILTALDLPTSMLSWDHIDPEAVQRSDSDAAVDGSRDDFWNLLNPEPGHSAAADVIIDHVSTLLFDGPGRKEPAHYEVWATLAQQYFVRKSASDEKTYEEFWDASEAWIDRLCPHTTRSNSWRDTATALCDAVRETEAPVVPVETESDGDNPGLGAVPLPQRGEQLAGGRQERHTRVVFLRNDDADSLPLPEALRRANRAVTSFSFPSTIVNQSPQPLGTRPFNRWQMLQELRQLPNSPAALESLEPDPLADRTEEAVEQQQGLIRFAATLYLYESEGGGVNPRHSELFGPGWRVRESSGISRNAAAAGRAIATLYLPTTDGRWEPARQLTVNQVATDRLGPLPEELDLEAFLTFLGVTPAQHEEGPPITLVEGGDDGRVPPRETPPALTEAGSGVSQVSLGLLPDSPEDSWNAETWRTALTEAWNEWLEQLLVQERTQAQDEESNEAATDLIDPLAERAWYPVDSDGVSARSPRITSLNTEIERIAPDRLTLLSSRQRDFDAVLWSVDEDVPDSDLLTNLGAIASVDATHLGANDAAPAFSLLEYLRTGVPLESLTDDKQARRGTINLFNRILAAIVGTEDHTDHPLDSLWLLCYEAGPSEKVFADRGLCWKRPSEAAWIVQSSEDRDTVRRFFPRKTLVTAEIGPRNLARYEPLSENGVRIEPEVVVEGSTDGSGAVTSTVEDELTTALPSLLALAEASLQIDADPGTWVDRWRQRSIEHVETVWVRYHAQFGETEIQTASWLEESAGNAFFVEEDSRRRIVFDTEGSHAGSPPPLAEFGAPLAELLFAEQRQDAASLFARALSEFDRDDGLSRLEQFVEKRDAEPLRRSYRRLLAPLAPEAEAELIEKTESALRSVGATLSLENPSVGQISNLGPDAVAVSDDGAGVTEAEIQDVLAAIDLGDAGNAYAPSFQCRRQHTSEWSSWLTEHSDRLLPYLEDRCQSAGIAALETEDIEERLDGYVRREQCPRVAFSPEQSVCAWLRDSGLPETAIPEPDELLSEVRKFAPRYDPVTEAAREAAEVGWTRKTAPEPEPSERETGTFDVSEAAERMRQQGAVGDEAEHAYREIVAKQTAACLETARQEGTLGDAVELLCQPFASDGKTVSNLVASVDAWRESGDPADLAPGLHVSTVWDGAGFDLLGLEDRDGSPTLTRYEVKALPGDGAPQARVHLSSNQISVYQKVCLTPDSSAGERYIGDWQLIGVEPSGRAIDLSSEIEELPSLLDGLRTEGYEHDGMVLLVNRDASVREEP